MADTSSKQPKRAKSRLILRLGSLLVSHSLLVSVVCCIAGLIALLLLPVLAMKTYISENALLPGSAETMFSLKDVAEAKQFVKDVIGTSAMEGKREGIPTLIKQHMADVGAEVYYHKFQAHNIQFHPLHFFASTSNSATTQSNGSCSSFGVNTVGILRAPRGDGKEAIVLVTPYNSENIQLSEALSLGLGYSIFSLLSRVAWLAKDIVWLAADSKYGEYTSVAAWLKEYHNPVYSIDSGKGNVDTCFGRTIHGLDNMLIERTKSNVFKRAGTMSAALVFKVVEGNERNERDKLEIYSEASNGQMPNLDLINTVHYLAVHRQGLSVMVDSIGFLHNSAWLKLVGEIMQGLCKVAKRFNPKWKFEVTPVDFVEGTATLASSIYHQALGVPTGSHGAFREYQVDAITLELSPRTSLVDVHGQSAFLLKSGSLIEGVIRSVNNLLEKFHQSFFLYFLTAPNKFVSVGVYMIAFALLVAPLPIVAAALFMASKRKGSKTTDAAVKTEEAENESESWKWIRAAKVLFTIHLWGVIVSLLPYLISRLPVMSSETSMLCWAALSILTYLILYLISGSSFSYSSSDGEWEVLKAVTVAAASIGLGLMSIVNFSTAQIGAMLMVPMCLIVQPLRRQVQKTVCLRAVLVLGCNLALGVIGFPPAALLLGKGLSQGFATVSIGDLWEWAEFLWAWNSATYLYLLLVHLPCWVLCMHILLHP